MDEFCVASTIRDRRTSDRRRSCHAIARRHAARLGRLLKPLREWRRCDRRL